jgi:hypothetical protein
MGRRDHPMQEHAPATSSPLHTKGFLFTNASGEIIFADRAFLRMTKQNPKQASLIKALPGVFNIDSPTALGLINEITNERFVHNREYSVKTTTGSLKPSYASGVGVYVQKDLFIGADILLLPVSSALGHTAPIDHSEIFQAYMDQALVESKLIGSGTFLQAYVTVHIETMQVLMHRIGGPQMRETLEQIINHEAQRLGVPATMRNGYLEFKTQKLYFDAYRMLYRMALSYAVNSIGVKLVEREMRMIDQKLDPKLIQLIQQDDLLSDHCG